MVSLKMNFKRNEIERTGKAQDWLHKECDNECAEIDLGNEKVDPVFSLLITAAQILPLTSSNCVLVSNFYFQECIVHELRLDDSGKSRVGVNKKKQAKSEICQR